MAFVSATGSDLCYCMIRHTKILLFVLLIYVYGNQMIQTTAPQLTILALRRHTEMFTVDALRCYACMGTQPGCSADQLDWRLVKNTECPDVMDVCVKITEKLFGEKCSSTNAGTTQKRFMECIYRE